MKWLIDLLTSSIGKKLVMALTGLFLILFLAVHLSGNLQLLKGDSGRAFNLYAEFMTTNPFIKVVSYGNYFFICLHAALAGYLSWKNSQARGSEGYAVKSGKSSAWSSRNMGILGSIILFFIIVHMRQFWAEMHWGGIPTANYDGKVVKDLYMIVADAFHNAWYLGLYCVSMIVLAFHLWHGFASAFQTLGLNHQKYNGAIRVVGRAFAIIVPALFALIPIVMYFEPHQ